MKPKSYYGLSAVIGLAIGTFGLFSQYEVLSAYFSTGEIVFKMNKYNFECVSECAVLANFGILASSFIFLAVGIDATKKLMRN